MWVHVRDKASPIDFVALLEYKIDNVGAIMAVPLLDERLGPEKFGGADYGYAMPEHLSLSRMLKPLFPDRHGAVAGTKNDVNEIAAAANLSKPRLIR